MKTLPRGVLESSGPKPRSGENKWGSLEDMGSREPDVLPGVVPRVEDQVALVPVREAMRGDLPRLDRDLLPMVPDLQDVAPGTQRLARVAAVVGVEEIGRASCRERV